VFQATTNTFICVFFPCRRWCNGLSPIAIVRCGPITTCIIFHRLQNGDGLCMTHSYSDGKRCDPGRKFSWLPRGRCGDLRWEKSPNLLLEPVPCHQWWSSMEPMGCTCTRVARVFTLQLAAKSVCAPHNQSFVHPGETNQHKLHPD
jgi:hypothetical protein